MSAADKVKLNSLTTGNSNWTQLGSTGIYYRKQNGMVLVYGHELTTSTSWTTIGTLPSGYRPTNAPVNTSGICGSNGNIHMAVTIGSNGVVKVSASSVNTGSGYFWTCFY